VRVGNRKKDTMVEQRGTEGGGREGER